MSNIYRLTMTTAEANDIINAFKGWKPGRKCVYSHLFNRCTEHDIIGEHDIPPFNYFADTPEAREAVRLLKDEFASCTGAAVDVHTRAVKGKPPLFGAWAGCKPQKAYGCAAIESHAIALAIAGSLKGD